MFDYNRYDDKTNEVFVAPFSEQANVLQSVIDKTIEEHPGAVIDIIGHSQGSIMVALADVRGIRKVVSMSPFFHTDIHKIMERYNKFSASEINVHGTSRRKRSDGTTTIIPAEYWSERFATDVYKIYNDLALKTDLTIIKAGEDQVMENPDLSKIFNTNIINVHGNHDFSKDYRPALLKVLEKIIVGV